MIVADVAIIMASVRSLEVSHVMDDDVSTMH